MGGVDSRDALSKYMENLHTEYADEVGLKYGMERGDSIKETGAVHRTTEEYRRKLWKEGNQALCCSSEGFSYDDQEP